MSLYSLLVPPPWTSACTVQLSCQTQAVLSKYGWFSARLQKFLGLLNHSVLTAPPAFIRKIGSIKEELLWVFSDGPRMLLIFGATLLSYVSGTPKIFRWPHHWGKRLGCLTFRRSITFLIEYCVSTQDVSTWKKLPPWCLTPFTHFSAARQLVL